MKNYIVLIVLAVLAFSCQEENNKGFVTFSGKIENYNKNTLIIFHPKKGYRKEIDIQEDGSFKDTLKVENGLFSFTDGKEITALYLENGDVVTMNYDANQFYKTLKFEGNHIAENEFLAISLKKENELLINNKLMRSPKKDFDSIINNYVSEFQERLNEKELDAPFKAFETKEIKNFKKYITNSYQKKNYNKLFLGKGKPSPAFSNYENFKGGVSSLEDFKGKYVYVDIWATWCQPCKKEIPFLKKLEEQYHNKNIEFVSISLDDKRGYEAWKEMIVNKQLGGTQLYANADQKFVNAYKVRSIPRFILIDPESNIVDANAPRPSSAQLNALLNSLPL